MPSRPSDGARPRPRYLRPPTGQAVLGGLAVSPTLREDAEVYGEAVAVLDEASQPRPRFTYAYFKKGSTDCLQVTCS